MLFFTSDTHFFDENLAHNMHFAHRNYVNASEMNQDIIDHWNKVVSPHDVVYHLGDVGLVTSNREGFTKLSAVLNKLNGQLNIIKGNHDTRDFFKFLEKNNYQLDNGKKKFVLHDVGCIIKFEHYQFFLTHYPLMLGISRNSINLHGHVHYYSINAFYNINVGVDTPESEYLNKKIEFGTPFSSSDVLEMLEAKKIDFQRRNI
ncbi:phosphoesterase [Liquorilactobacillus sucicola DSM 21376 = JCM 15457]|uniref:Phosphoesterase n=1 Tax=Liquorilactobacillus sucicola DSM 21376 = JCM 15457 TaxID=1423806 RepID=A0A0R2DQU8_9LACO|nr:metallophosphoesterase family protein [Liquorilactobacillus sucicola]KRN06449.1 phosphoesterase [Liquorilactobacillus sucicola DSM 21376 = JCM 15457]